jgi:hypothetical protein
MIPIPNNAILNDAEKSNLSLAGGSDRRLQQQPKRASFACW